MLLGPYTSFFEPHGELYGKHTPGEPKNQSHVNDPIVTDLLDRQRRTLDVTNYAPNYGNDYGGRLMAAWVER